MTHSCQQSDLQAQGHLHQLHDIWPLPCTGLAQSVHAPRLYDVLSWWRQWWPILLLVWLDNQSFSYKDELHGAESWTDTRGKIRLPLCSMVWAGYGWQLVFKVSAPNWLCAWKWLVCIWISQFPGSYTSCPSNPHIPLWEDIQSPTSQSNCTMGGGEGRRLGILLCLDVSQSYF